MTVIFQPGDWGSNCSLPVLLHNDPILGQLLLDQDDFLLAFYDEITSCEAKGENLPSVPFSLVSNTRPRWHCTWIQRTLVELGELHRRLSRENAVGASQHDWHPDESRIQHVGENILTCWVRDRKEREPKPSNRQSVSDDPLAAAGVLDVHRDRCRVGHVSEATLTKHTGYVLNNQSSFKLFITFYNIWAQNLFLVGFYYLYVPQIMKHVEQNWTKYNQYNILFTRLLYFIWVKIYFSCWMDFNHTGRIFFVNKILKIWWDNCEGKGNK